MGRLEGKVAVITGAGLGIGKAAALLFAREGAAVGVVARSATNGPAVVEEIKAAGGRAAFFQADVADAEQIKAAVDGTVAAFGGLDAIYNNAGGSSTADGPLHEVSAEEILRVVGVDLLGTMWASRAALPHLIARGGGSIIHSASTAALKGLGNLSAYSAAKGGLLSLTRSMAVDYAPHRIRVNCISPGATNTERRMMLHAQRTKPIVGVREVLAGASEPVEVAYGALYLASDESLRVTGQIFPIDGGISIA